MTDQPKDEAFTAGPWAHGLDDIDAVCAVNTPEDGGNVISVPPPDGCVASHSRWIANARLIAALRRPDNTPRRPVLADGEE